MSVAASASTTTKAPETSPIHSDARPALRRMTYNGAARPVVGGESKQARDEDHFYYFWRDGKWFMRDHHRGPNPEDIVLRVEHPKNKAVRGALEKLQRGIPAKRETTEYLMEGIRKWIDEKRVSAYDRAQEEAFVKYVWHHMRQKQRDNKAAVEARRLQIGLAGVKYQLEGHYAEFPDERKSDDELVAMFRKLGHWTDVSTSEQRRIASKKRHEKEEKLIHDKFCGDRAAYNRWKALNEQVSYGRIRDVAPQLLVKFANWLASNPDYLYPGSRCAAVSTAEHSLIQGSREPDFATVMMTRADVSKEHMLAAIGSVMDGLETGTCTVTLKFDRSPKQFTMTDKYPLLLMHGCQRLMSGSEHRMVAVHSDKLVFKQTTTMTKRLPDEYHNQLKGHCEREGLFKEVTCRKVFEYTPGLVTSVLFRGQTSQGDPFHIRLRLTGRANQTFDFEAVRNAKRANFVDALKQEAMTKKEVAKQARLASARAPAPPSPMSSSKNLVQELAELSKLFSDGLLSEDEFKKAKSRLL